MPVYPGSSSNRAPRQELWTKDTDLVLRDLVLRSGEVDWSKIALAIEWDSGTVTPAECRERWTYVKDTPVKGPWSSEEDDHLKRLVDEYGAKKWNLLARAFPGRSGKQCRERWHNHVDAHIKKGEWSAEEDQILCEAQRQLGNKWSEMSRILTGRSENAIKNRFNSLNAKGLAETRANELMAKLNPKEKAEIMLKDAYRVPAAADSRMTAAAFRHHDSSSSSSSRRASSSKPPPPSCRNSNNSSGRARGDAGGNNPRTAGSRDGDRLGNDKEDQRRILSAMGLRPGSESGRSGGGRDDDGDDDHHHHHHHHHHQHDARVGKNYSGAAVAADGAVGPGADSHDGGGGEDDESDEGDDPGDSGRRGWAAAAAAAPAVGGKRGRSPKADAGGRWRWEGEAGDGGIPVSRGAKREKGGLARRKPEMARAEAGMSVLAQAAGLLDIEDSVEEDGSGSVRSYSDNSSSNESFARSYGGRLLPGYRHHGGGGGVPDHGSTPPGSASPPPSGGSAGGMAATGDGAPSFGGGNGNGQAFASAFAVGTGETVRTGGEQGYRDDGSSSGNPAGTGGARGAVAGGAGGAPLQRPGWLVGPGGVQQRRSLQSVPGPWRPYWKDSSSGGGGGNDDCVGAAVAALRQHGGDEINRGTGDQEA